MAGVSILALTGDKNIINQSFEAKDQTAARDIEEEIMQQWLLVQNETINEYYDDEDLASKLQVRLKNKNSSASVLYSDNQYYISYKGYSFIFDLQTHSITQVK